MTLARAAGFKGETMNRQYALGRLKPGEMNKTEKRYAEFLWGEKVTGRILWYKFESITLKLAEKLRYTADFAVMRNDGVVELHDVKGRTNVTRKSGERVEKPFSMDDSRQKMKMAADTFPFVIVVVFQSKTGEWIREEF
jgi:hypothetical protein